MFSCSRTYACLWTCSSFDTLLWHYVKITPFLVPSIPSGRQKQTLLTNCRCYVTDTHTNKHACVYMNTTNIVNPYNTMFVTVQISVCVSPSWAAGWLDKQIRHLPRGGHRIRNTLQCNAAQHNNSRDYSLRKSPLSWISSSQAQHKLNIMSFTVVELIAVLLYWIAIECKEKVLVTLFLS